MLSELAGGSITCAFGLLTLSGELSIRCACLAELAFQMADPPAQELALLGDSGHLTLGFLERSRGLVRRCLGRPHRIGRALRGMLR